MRRRERGIAALTAILVVAVAASAAAMMLSQQSAMLDQTLLVASRAQADQYATAGLDWARGVLTQDARSTSVDSLKEGWAQPIVGMPIERAVVAGSISDEQAKLNLNNLVQANKSEADVKVFKQLLSLLELDPALADNAADWISPHASDAYYLALPRPYRSAKEQRFSSVEELLRVRGFDARIVAKLRPYVTAIPEKGDKALNVNTASEVVLAAMFLVDRGHPKFAAISAIVAERTAKPFANKNELLQRLQHDGLATPNDLDVASQWFSVRVSVSQDDVQLGTEALVRRAPAPDGTATVVWRRGIY